MTITEINAKYPIRNPVWSFHQITGRWVTEASDLSLSGGNLDPWNRVFPPSVGKRRLMDSANEEVVGWVYSTTVSGTPIECVIFND